MEVVMVSVWFFMGMGAQDSYRPMITQSSVCGYTGRNSFGSGLGNEK